MKIPVIEECKCGEDALLECVNGVFIVSCKNCNTHTGYYDGATETIEVWNKETNKAKREAGKLKWSEFCGLENEAVDYRNGVCFKTIIGPYGVDLKVYTHSGKSTPTSHSEATNLAQRISDGLVLLRENGF